MRASGRRVTEADQGAPQRRSGGGVTVHLCLIRVLPATHDEVADALGRAHVHHRAVLAPEQEALGAVEWVATDADVVHTHANFGRGVLVTLLHEIDHLALLVLVQRPARAPTNFCFAGARDAAQAGASAEQRTRAGA